MSVWNWPQWTILCFLAILCLTAAGKGPDPTTRVGHVLRYAFIAVVLWFGGFWS
jgi:hypothetical protein